MSEKMYKPEEFAKLIGVGVSTLKKWRAEDKGPAYIQIDRVIRYPERSYRKYVDDNLHDPSRGGRRNR